MILNIIPAHVAPLKVQYNQENTSNALVEMENHWHSPNSYQFNLHNMMEECQTHTFCY